MLPLRSPLVLLVAASLLGACGGNGGADESGHAPWVAEDRPDLSVTVTDASSGAPLPGAWLVLDPGGRDAVTGDDGVAAFAGVDPGDYVVVASAADHADATADVAVGDADAAATLALSPLSAAGSLAGTVLDPTGEPVADVAVLVDGAEVARTADDGTYLAEDVAAGTVSVAFEPASPLRTWSWPAVEIPEGGVATVSPTLPAGPTDATYLGSQFCSYCHNDLADTWPTTGHARVARAPADVEVDGEPAGLQDAFAAGGAVALDELVPGAQVTLARTGTGAWTARVEDAAGATTGDMPVVEVYGGLRTGAALAVEVGGTRALLPLAWALPGQGLSTEQDAAGWVARWTDGWFDATGALTLDAIGAPGPDASWDLQCAGCHATGQKLEEDADGHYALASVGGLMERVVGCEACHGPGSAHYEAVAAGEPPARYILNPKYLPAWQRVEVCARCHERVDDTTHPFSDAPAWPVDATGAALDPFAVVEVEATGAPERWLEAGASRLHRDQAGDFRDSPHRSGTDGYMGACEDCHELHAGEHEAGLRKDFADNDLCTSCHASRFPDEAAESAHSGHTNFAPGRWSPGSCNGCHFPRMSIAVRPDAVSGAGEVRAHTMTFIEPGAALAEFDAEGADRLAHGDVPVAACIDCHAQNDAEANDAGENCPCPESDPTRRSTFEDFQTIFEAMRGTAE